MRALALEHLRPDPVGVFGEVLVERGIGVDRILLYEGELVPDWRRYDLDRRDGRRCQRVAGGGVSLDRK